MVFVCYKEDIAHFLLVFDQNFQMVKYIQIGPKNNTIEIPKRKQTTHSTSINLGTLYNWTLFNKV